MRIRDMNTGEKITLTAQNKTKNENDKVLWENEWLRVKMKDGWYTCTESTKGDGIAVCVFRPKTKEVLIRYEHTPCHGEGLRQTSITGMMDKGETPDQTALRELKEETGITANSDELLGLGWVFNSKSSSDKTYLFAVDGSNKEIGEIVGDGTKGEEGAYVKWESLEIALQLNAPSVLASLAKLCARGLMKL